MQTHIDLIAFDLNGTLLDMSTLDPYFTHAFDSPLAREAWFEELRALWTKANRPGEYQPFDELAKRALDSLAQQFGKTVDPEEEAIIFNQMKALPPFLDVKDALMSLRKTGKPIAALTNGTMKSARAQLAHAKLDHLFDAVFSADEVECYKPAAEPYSFMLKKTGVRADRALMVAAHAWDVAGAKAVGMKTAYLGRPAKTPPQGAKADFDLPDLGALADKLKA